MNQISFALILLGLIALILTYRIHRLMKNQTDLQASLDLQNTALTQVEAKVAALEEAATGGAVDLTAQVEQVEAQTARLTALL